MTAERLTAAFAHIAISSHDSDFAGHHHIRCTADPINQGMAATVKIVELGLGHGIVDVKRREQKVASLRHLVEPVNARGRLFRHTSNVLVDAMKSLGIAL